MDYFDSIILAVLQGLTEFLPVSSSGHLALAQHLLEERSDPDRLLSILFHTATGIALLVYLRKDIGLLCRALVFPGRSGSSIFAGSERKILFYIGLAMIPTALIGLCIERFFIDFLYQPLVIGINLFATGSLLWLTKGTGVTPSGAPMRGYHAICIGVLQGLSASPGISRSGITITGSILLGLNRELAARFSLLISLPAIAGATYLEISKLETGVSLLRGPYLAGMLVAAVVGYGAISMILRLVRTDTLYAFAWYLWPLGMLTIVYFQFLK